MFQFTHGSPDEMQVWIACGIAAYLTVFPLVVLLAAVCGEVTRRTQPDGPNAAAPGEAPAPGPVGQRGAVAPRPAPSEPVVGTAA